MFGLGLLLCEYTLLLFIVSLRGQVVWITGASSGIGEHLAYVLSKAGCQLVLSARREEELDRVKRECLKREHSLFMSDIVYYRLVVCTSFLVMHIFAVVTDFRVFCKR